MGISSDFKKRFRERWQEQVLRRRIDFCDPCTAPNVYVVDMALLLFGKPASIATGRELVEELVLQEVLWFFNKPQGRLVVLAWDQSKYVTPAKGPEQRRRDAQHKLQAIRDEEKRKLKEKAGQEVKPKPRMPENLDDGPLPEEWYKFLGADRARRARAFKWVEQQLERKLPDYIPPRKRVLICHGGRVRGFRRRAEDEGQQGPPNPQELHDMRNTVGEADFAPMFVDRYLDRHRQAQIQRQQEGQPKPPSPNILVRSIDQDAIPMGLMLAPERLGLENKLANHVYVMLSNRAARPDEEAHMRKLHIVEDEEEEREARAGRKPYVPKVRDYFDVNATWRCMLRYYKLEAATKFKGLENPIENICYLMFLAGSDLVSRPEQFSNKNPLPDVGAGFLWYTYEEYYDSIGPLVKNEPRQYYPPKRRDDAPYVFTACYEALWKLVRLVKQIKMKARINTTGTLLPYDTLQRISLDYADTKHYPDKHEMWVTLNNALYALHYYANGHRGADIVPSCVERGKDGLPRWGFELIDPNGEEVGQNVRRSSRASGEKVYLPLANREFPIYL